MADSTRDEQRWGVAICKVTYEQLNWEEGGEHHERPSHLGVSGRILGRNNRSPASAPAHVRDQRRCLPLHKVRAGQAPSQLFPVERKAPKFPGSVNCPCVYTICPVAREHDNASDAETGSWCGGNSGCLEAGRRAWEMGCLNAKSAWLSSGEHPNGSETEAWKITNIQAF